MYFHNDGLYDKKTRKTYAFQFKSPWVGKNSKFIRLHTIRILREDSDMRVSRYRIDIFFYMSPIGVCILLTGLVLSLAGCGGSNLKNPVSEDITTAEDSEATDDVVELTQTPDVAAPKQVSDLDVKVTVTKKIVQPGEMVELTASVKQVRGTRVTLNWLNITQLGTLSAHSENPVTWTAPQTLDGENVQVEVIQLVVTVISEVVSVGSSGIETDTQIFTDTKNVLLTVRN